MDGRRDQDPKERKEESESQGGLGEEEAIPKTPNSEIVIK